MAQNANALDAANLCAISSEQFDVPLFDGGVGPAAQLNGHQRNQNTRGVEYGHGQFQKRKIADRYGSLRKAESVNDHGDDVSQMAMVTLFKKVRGGSLEVDSVDEMIARAAEAAVALNRALLARLKQLEAKKKCSASATPRWVLGPLNPNLTSVSTNSEF
uniref:Uncharacterized protein n=1 Tax=Globodera rostochiensis TaxID=31243 RepID=A0A914HVN9_GLORO